MCQSVCCFEKLRLFLNGQKFHSAGSLDGLGISDMIHRMLGDNVIHDHGFGHSVHCSVYLTNCGTGITRIARKKVQLE